MSENQKGHVPEEDEAPLPPGYTTLKRFAKEHNLEYPNLRKWMWSKNIKHASIGNTYLVLIRDLEVYQPRGVK